MEIKKLVKRADSNNHIVELLEGKGEYKCELNAFIGANVPTDWAQVLDSGIYAEYRENKNIHLKEKMEEAIKSMCNGKEYDLYCASMVLFFQIMSEKQNEAPFEISSYLIPILKMSLQNSREKLKAYRELTGKLYDDGIWGDINRINTILKEDYGITII